MFGRLFQHLKESLYLVLIFFGIILLILKLRFDGETGDLLQAAGTAILAAGVFAAVTKSFMYIGIFKATLKDAISEGIFKPISEDVTNRVELSLSRLLKVDLKSREDVWDYLTDSLFLEKFNGPTAEIRRYILDKFFNFPPRKAFYYSRLRISVMMSHGGRAGIVKTTECSRFSIVAPTEEPIDYAYGTFIKASAIEGICNPMAIKKFFVNGVDNKNNLKTDRSLSGDQQDIVNVSSIELRGGRNYNIEIEVEKIYDVRRDNFKTFATNKYVHDFEMDFIYPEGIEVFCIPWGIGKARHSNHRLTLADVPLLFPGQGCIFVIK